MKIKVINSDISLFNEKFPNVFDWNRVSFKVDGKICYNVEKKIISLSEDSLKIDWFWLHEMGHALHHLLFKFKRFRFSSEYQITIPLYWGIPNYKRDHYEIFADVFADTMLKFKNTNYAMFEYNNKIIKLLQDVSKSE